MFKKIISLVVSILFLFSSLSYGLSPMQGSEIPGTKEDMYAAGQKGWAAKHGPGWFSFSLGEFVGERPENSNVRILENTDTLPEGWENNPVLKAGNLIEALELYRKFEARIPSDELIIEEGYFDVGYGELPIARIEKKGDQYVLVVHTNFVQMWNHIKKNDVVFEYTFEDGTKRVVSLAMGLMYRIAKHEMMEEARQAGKIKGGGHVGYLDKNLSVMRSEITANSIGGRYATINDAIWLWFLASYSFTDGPRYNNDIFRDRIDWIFPYEGKKTEARSLGLPYEFPNLLYNRNELAEATSIALMLNYHFFSKKDEKGKLIKVSREITAEETFKKIYEFREDSITDILPATGEENNIGGYALEYGPVWAAAYVKQHPDERGIVIEAYEKAGRTKDLETFNRIIEAKTITQDLSASESSRRRQIRREIPPLQSRPLTKEEQEEAKAKRREHENEQAINEIAGDLDARKEEEYVKRHPEQIGGIVQDIIDEEKNLVAVLEEFVVPAGEGKGPGSEEVNANEFELIIRTVELLHQNKIEIVLPQSFKITSAVKKALRDLRKKEGKDVITINEYSSEEHLSKILQQEVSEGAKRIVLTEENISGEISSLLGQNAELFKDVKVLNITLPKKYDEMTKGEKTIHQTRYLMIAVLARLLEKGKTPFVEALLRELLKDHLSMNEAGLEEFIENLSTEDESSEMTIKRVTYFLGNIVSLINKLGEDYRFMKKFWTYA